MKRKTLITITAAAAVLTLAGCSGGGSHIPANLSDDYVDSLKNVNVAERAMFDRINQYRKASGLIPFEWNAKLHMAAKAHANYCDINHHYDHDENPDGKLYFGSDPQQRVQNTGYQYYGGEDISFDGWDANSTESGYAEIDGLMTAIYHRKPLISQDLTEVGTGVNDEVGVTGVVDFGRVPKDKKTNYDYVLFPAKNAKNVVSYFFGESPDPLKDTNAYSSGNPVSIFFKEGCNVKMDTFTLKDINTSHKAEILKIMTGENDPNSRFSSCDFALYPKYAMRRGHTYEAVFKYNHTRVIRWRFQIYTAPPPDGIELKVTKNYQVFKIKNGQKYYLNILPNYEVDEYLNSWTYEEVDGFDYAHLELNPVSESQFFTLFSKDNTIDSRSIIVFTDLKDRNGNPLKIGIIIVR